MAVINGTPGNDDVPPLDGTTDPDTIDGLAGNDIINGFAGNDTIFGGEGNDIINGDDGDDTLHGGAGVFVDKMFGGNGNDLFIKDGLTDNFGGTQLDAFLGDAGTDTLELRAVAAPVLSPLGNLSQHQLFGGFGSSFFTNFESIERLVFASQAGQTVGALLHEGTLGDAGVAEMVGGAGRDFASFLTNVTGTFTLPVLTYTNWTPVSANAWTQTGDFIALVSVVGTATLNAAAGLNVNQALIGGTGNDVLNGSANADLLNGSARNQPTVRQWRQRCIAYSQQRATHPPRRARIADNADRCWQHI